MKNKHRGKYVERLLSDIVEFTSDSITESVLRYIKSCLILAYQEGTLKELEKQIKERKDEKTKAA